MTVETLHLQDSFVANGTQTVFLFTFQTLSPTDVIPYVNGVMVVGLEVVLNEDQTTDPGGTVTWETAPPNGAVVKLQREIPYTQETDYEPYSSFPAKTHEDTVDRIVMQIQQLTNVLDYIYEVVTEFRMTTPKTLLVTEVVLTTTAAAFPRVTGRVSAEVQNNGPNPIIVGDSSAHLYRILQPKESWTVDFDGAIWGKATVANQVAGAATALSELSE